MALSSSLARSAPPDRVRFALLSDTHIAADRGDIYRGFHPHENLQRVLDAVGRAHFDFLLINGDLARLEGRPADYEALTGYLDPVTQKLPLAVTLGNHDDRKNARGALASLSGDVQTVEKKFVSTIDAGPAEFILLDSLMVTNIAAGQLGKAQRDWLSTFLSRPGSKPAVLIVHHNPDPDDDGGLVDAARLLDVAHSAPRVKAIFFGHTHSWRHERQSGLHLVNLPAVGYNFKDSEPVGWTEGEFTARGAELRLNAIGGNMQANGEQLRLAWR